MMGLRMGLGYLVAIGTSLIVDWQYRRHGNKLLTPLATPSSLPLADEDAPEERRPFNERLLVIVQTALHDFVDIMVYLVLGALIASLTRQLIPKDLVATLSHQFPGVAILVMMGLAVVLCLCSEADAFVAASYTTLRPAAKLAFLVLGPMLDFKLYSMYTRRLPGAPLIWTIFLSVIVQDLPVLLRRPPDLGKLRPGPATRGRPGRDRACHAGRARPGALTRTTTREIVHGPFARPPRRPPVLRGAAADHR